MTTLREIIWQECLKNEDKAYEIALHSPRDSWDLYQEYLGAKETLSNWFNEIGIT